jgi:hypothetical protein
MKALYYLIPRFWRADYARIAGNSHYMTQEYD